MGLQPLLRGLSAPNVAFRQQLAAVEALADIPRDEVVLCLQEIADRFGDFSGANKKQYVSELHAEALRSLAWAEARSRKPRLTEPRFEAALASPFGSVRREALLGLADGRFGALPTAAVRLSNDPEAIVRAAAIVMLAARQHPEAADALRRGLWDRDLSVRLAAVAGLARLGGEAEQQELRRIASRDGELLRAAAVEALARLGDQRTVVAAADDKSWRVRQAVARSLAAGPNADSVSLAQRMVGDANSAVARTAIEALGNWPLSDAGPILLSAMASRSFLPRKAASEQLAERWKPAAEFPFEAGAEVREPALQRLRDCWQQDSGRLNVQALPSDAALSAHSPSQPILAVEPHPTTAPRSAPISPAREQEVAALVAQLEAAASADERSTAVHRLVACGAELPPIVERLFDETHRPLPEAMFRDVLPSVSAEFALIDRFTSPTVAERRQAANALRAWAAERPLTPVALERLATLAVRETDALVWIGTLTALADDGREPSLRIGYAGLGHPSPEVRRRACEHLGAHPEAQHGQVLSLSLADPSPQVVKAAAKALGRLPTLDDSRPLEQLLSVTDHELRVAAAESLCRLQKPSGVEALTRLAGDPDSRVRREAAAAMGSAPDPAFVPVLIRLLDDRPEVRRAALLSLPKVTGQQQPTTAVVPAAAYQSVTASVEGSQNDAQRWKDWYRSQSAPR